jgi:hypothetical protein
VGHCGLSPPPGSVQDTTRCAMRVTDSGRASLRIAARQLGDPGHLSSAGTRSGLIETMEGEEVARGPETSSEGRRGVTGGRVLVEGRCRPSHDWSRVRVRIDRAYAGSGSEGPSDREREDVDDTICLRRKVGAQVFGGRTEIDTYVHATGKAAL